MKQWFKNLMSKTEDRPISYAEQFLDNPIFKIVSSVAAEKGVRAFVIGGYVRDCFLGVRSGDIDIVVEGSGPAFARAVGKIVPFYSQKKHRKYLHRQKMM